MLDLSEVVLVVNGMSRLGGEFYLQAKQLLEENGYVLKDCALSSSVQEMRSTVMRHRDQVSVIFVGGGDGTQGLVAGMLIGSETAQGVLPLGTGNSFARDLGIPTDLNAAIEALAIASPTHIDIGLANDRAFVNVATMGLTSLIVKNLTHSLKKRWGRAAYFLAIARGFESLKSFWVKLESDQGNFEMEAFQVVIGTGRYHAGPFPVLPDASLFNQHLSLYILPGASKVDLIKTALGLPSGRHTLFSDVHSESIKSGKIIAVPSQSVIVDGEPIGRADLKFECVAGGLKVLYAKDSED